MLALACKEVFHDAFDYLTALIREEVVPERHDVPVAVHVENMEICGEGKETEIGPLDAFPKRFQSDAAGFPKDPCLVLRALLRRTISAWWCK